MMPIDRTLRITTATEREIRMTREFDAPRHLVFEALTRPELLRRWLGVFGDWSMELCEIDLTVGGSYRYVWRRTDGERLGMHGVYREIRPTVLLVATEAFDESWYSGEALTTTELSQHGSTTTVTVTTLFESQASRDMALRSGMEHGVSAGYEALDVLLASEPALDTIAARYRRRADRFEATVAAVRPEQWSQPSPCEKWTARDVVGHIITMHAVMLRPLGRELSPAPSLDADPLGAFKAARADVEAILADPTLAEAEGDTPSGRLTVAAHVDRVVSADMVFHRWDLARATGQGDTLDPVEVEAAWAGTSALPPELLEQFRTPGAFGPGVEVFGAEVKIAEDAPLQDRLLGLIGRDPSWSPPVGRRA
jgi:uncharacterized protein (TIGR03086 family)